MIKGRVVVDVDTDRVRSEDQISAHNLASPHGPSSTLHSTGTHCMVALSLEILLENYHESGVAATTPSLVFLFVASAAVIECIFRDFRDFQKNCATTCFQIGV